MFQFKQFAVDQTGCAMKINTDGVLLGALANSPDPKQILDIGTGTGVIALMLAQRFEQSLIDAVEIDRQAYQTAKKNFEGSKFAERLTAYHNDFIDFLSQHPDHKYDLILSNPPFYIDSLKSPGKEKAIAKHADTGFFEGLIKHASKNLRPDGLLWLILPIETSELVRGLAANSGLHVHEIIDVRSYPESLQHRHIVAFAKVGGMVKKSNFTIYNSPKVYSAQYQGLLQPFFTIF